MICEQLSDIIEKSREEYFNMLEEVCNIESPTAFKKGVDDVGAYFLDIAKRHNWKTEIFKQDISGDVVCITLNPYAKGTPISLSTDIWTRLIPLDCLVCL